MNYPKVRFIHDPDKQAEHLCFVAKNISENLFQKAGLPILPYPHPKAIYFPNLSYSPKFWNEIKKCGSRNFDEQFPKFCVAELLPKIPKTSPDTEPQWRLIEPQFFKLYSDFLNSKKILSQVASITVLSTQFGTHGSFYSRNSKGKISIYATHRSDLPVGILVKTLLLALYKVQVRSLAETGSWRWQDRQSVVDYLMQFTPFSRFLPNYSAYNYSLDNLSQKCRDYLAQLGFSPPPLSINTGDSGFTAKEKIFLRLLQNRLGELVSFDEVAQALWGEAADSKFSLAAMARILADVRYKLREQGIHQNIITTVRGQGYLLNSST